MSRSDRLAALILMKRAIVTLLCSAACTPASITLLEPGPDGSASESSDGGLTPSRADASVPDPSAIDGGMPACTTAMSSTVMTGGFEGGGFTDFPAGVASPIAPHLRYLEPDRVGAVESVPCIDSAYISQGIVPRHFERCSNSRGGRGAMTILRGTDWADPDRRLLVADVERRSIHWHDFTHGYPGVITEISFPVPHTFANMIALDTRLYALTYEPSIVLGVHTLLTNGENIVLPGIHETRLVRTPDRDLRSPRLFESRGTLWIAYGTGSELVAGVLVADGNFIEHVRERICPIDQQETRVLGSSVWSIVRCGSDVHWLDLRHDDPSARRSERVTCTSAEIAPRLEVRMDEAWPTATIAFWNAGEPSPVVRHYNPGTRRLSREETRFDIRNNGEVMPGGIDVALTPTTWAISFIAADDDKSEAWMFSPYVQVE